jgi:predicted membrane channel-forming protein YqfA (hemolysin III family)
MWLTIGKTVVAAILISFVSWLSGRKTGLAGFLTALPLTTLLALAFSHMEWGDNKQSVEYAKSIFVAIPVSLLFFIPFLLAEKLNLNFWTCYIGGVALLGGGYFIHAQVIKYI